MAIVERQHELTDSQTSYFSKLEYTVELYQQTVRVITSLHCVLYPCTVTLIRI